MIVTGLKLANVRAIETAEFRFQPGFNLIVGVNGVGKTSVLYALGVCLSAVVKYANGLRYKKRTFSLNDLRVGTEALTVECEIQLDGTAYTYLVHNPRRNQRCPKEDGGRAAGAGPRHSREGRVHRRRTIPLDAAHERSSARYALLDTPFTNFCAGAVEHDLGRGGGLWRHVPMHSPTGISGLASSRRGCGWSRRWRWNNRLPSASLQRSGRQCRGFFPKHSDLRVNDEKPPKLLIDHDDMPLPVAQLSDGERGLVGNGVRPYAPLDAGQIRRWRTPLPKPKRSF